MWVTQKANLVFNWVTFLGGFIVQYQTVSLNSKFRSFLVLLLIWKDNIDNKVFKKEFYTKDTTKKGIEMTNCCKF